MKELTVLYWLSTCVLFYAELITLVVFAAIPWSRRAQCPSNVLFSSPIRQLEGIVVFEAIAAVAGYFAIPFLREVYFLKFAVIYVILVTVLGLILAPSCSIWGSIGFALVIAIMEAKQVRVFPVISSFSADVIGWLKPRERRVVQLFFLVTFVGKLPIVTLFFELTGFARYHASSIHWSAFFHVVVIVLHWHPVLVFRHSRLPSDLLLFARHCFRVANGFGVWGGLPKYTFSTQSTPPRLTAFYWRSLCRWTSSRSRP
jgi:hypothetical protein